MTPLGGVGVDHVTVMDVWLAAARETRVGSEGTIGETDSERFIYTLIVDTQGGTQNNKPLNEGDRFLKNLITLVCTYMYYM